MPQSAAGPVAPGIEIAGKGDRAAAARAAQGAADSRQDWQDLLAALGMKEGGGSPPGMRSAGLAGLAKSAETQEDPQLDAGGLQETGSQAETKVADISAAAAETATTSVTLNRLRAPHANASAKIPPEDRPGGGPSAGGTKGVSGERRKKQESAPVESVAGAAYLIPISAFAGNWSQPTEMSRASRGHSDAAPPPPAVLANPSGAGRDMGAWTEENAARGAEIGGENRDGKLLSAASRREELAHLETLGAGPAHREGSAMHSTELAPSIQAAADQDASNPVSADQDQRMDAVRAGARHEATDRAAASLTGPEKRTRAGGEGWPPSARSGSGFASERDQHAGSLQPGSALPETAVLARDLSESRSAAQMSGEHSGGGGASAHPSGGETFAALDAGAGPGTPRWSHATPVHAEAGFQDPALGWVGVRADSTGSGIHAAVVPGSADAALALAGHMAGLGAHLAAQHLPVHSVSVAAPDTSGAGWGAGEGGDQGAHGDGGNREQSGAAAVQEGMQRTPPLIAAAPDSPQSVPANSGGGLPIRGGEYISVLA